MLLQTSIILIICLLISICLASVSSSFRRIRKHQSKSQVEEIGRLFFFSKIQRFFLKKAELDTLLYATICTENIFRFLFVSTGIVCIFIWQISPHISSETIYSINWILSLVFFIFFILTIIFFGDFFPRIFSNRNPHLTIKILAPIVSILLTICLPLTYLFLKYSDYVLHGISTKSQHKTNLIKEKIIELIQEFDTQEQLDINQKKLIESVLTFKDRIVRETMIPRIDVFTLPSKMKIKEATQLMSDKGFSRAPVYKKDVDHIIGILMYKDILNLYLKCDKTQDYSPLDNPIEKIIKGVLYTPETKKVSKLLQEFREKKMHIAIVVDEYGGTEGIITIEDILEEIVGDIADEYDKEVPMFSVSDDDGWIVDAKMSIWDIEEHLGLKIPQDGDYDTIGGYVFHKAGEVPTKGLIIHHDHFELEITKLHRQMCRKNSY